MNILVYGNRKADDSYYDISTPEKEAAAYLLLFKELKDEWQVYSDLETNAVLDGSLNRKEEQEVIRRAREWTRFRMRHGYSQPALAEKLGCTSQTVANIENRRVAYPHPRILRRFEELRIQG